MLLEIESEVADWVMKLEIKTCNYFFSDFSDSKL